jgi:hypothetical protein
MQQQGCGNMSRDISTFDEATFRSETNEKESVLDGSLAKQISD